MCEDRGNFLDRETEQSKAEVELIDAYHWVHQRYGADIAQEAYTLAAERRKAPNAVMFLARALRAGGYHDGLIRYSRHGSWHRECLTPHGMIAPDDAYWQSSVGRNPFLRIWARINLEKIPAFVIDWHLEDGYIWRNRCRHDNRWLFPKVASTGKKTVGCRQCASQRCRRWRRKASARQEQP